MTIIDALFGTKSESDLKKLLPILNKINAKESWALGLKADEFPAQTKAFKERLVQGETLDDLLPEAFALVREAARRALGERPYDVQLIGAVALHQGRITEMKTGEGKTLSCTPAAYLNALEGKGVHVITVNDYLAERDAKWMKPVYDYLGVSVGWIISSQEPESRLPHYRADITYGTNNEFGFDYLRDNMRYELSEKLQQHHHYCIIDEIDSILIDEARTPLIISGSTEEDTRKYGEANRVVPQLEECTKDPATGEYWTNGIDQEYPEDKPGDYKLDEKGKRILFTNKGLNKIEALLHRQKSMDGSIFDGGNIEWIHLVTQAMRAHKLFHLDTEYVVKEGQVQIVDEFTGRVLHGRRYSDGLHQAIEAKEGIKVAQRNRTLATITFQNFFRMYDKLSGMTGTAETEAKEFGKIYGLDVVVVPTNRPVQRADEDDLIFLNEKDKFEAICDEIVEVHKKGQPILVGTVSIEKSERLSTALTRRGVKHEVLNAKNHAREAVIVAEAGAKGGVVIATNMAGRGTDIKLGGNLEHRARKRAGTDASPEDFKKALDAERVQWLKDQDEVRSLGGLYIIGTERHESRRIDNQLRGRSGRQGDPGKSCFFISLDDDLMRLFGGGAANLKGMLSRVGMQPGEALNHPLLNRAIEKAQNKVEERNFEIRKHLLEFDDVLNEQRKFIYGQRDSIIADKNLVERVLVVVREQLEEDFEEYLKSRGEDKEALENGLEKIKTSLFWAHRQSVEHYAALPCGQLVDALVAEVRADQERKRDLAGTDYFNLVVRFEYLRLIDSRWQDHLENLDALREAVYLRSYAQKNPLLEYKLEGFQIFDEMLQDIRMTVTKRILLI
jgi:preprotein translocase subunit SecA